MEDTSIIPVTLLETSILLAGELAWPKQSAQDVVDYLSSNGIAVISVELWLPDGNVPIVTGWSEYEVKDFADWDSYVKQNAKHATDIITNVAETSVVFNLSWIDEDEYRLLNTMRS